MSSRPKSANYETRFRESYDHRDQKKMKLPGYLEEVYSQPMQHMLTPQELIPTLQLDRTTWRSACCWMASLRKVVGQLRQVLGPLQKNRLSLPGFNYLVQIRVLSIKAARRVTRETRELEVRSCLWEWLHRHDMTGFTPDEAVLIMNAWPKDTRHMGASLSDFLTEARARYDYSVLRTHWPNPTGRRLRITFDYAGIQGMLIAE